MCVAAASVNSAFMVSNDGASSAASCFWKNRLGGEAGWGCFRVRFFLTAVIPRPCYHLLTEVVSRLDGRLSADLTAGCRQD